MKMIEMSNPYGELAESRNDALSDGDVSINREDIKIFFVFHYHDLCDGTRMVFQRMCSHVLEAHILSEISLAPSDTSLRFILERR
ncbi:hypothetical protein LAZ67_16001697 [Cordylochernes scorpioides]|uniref:Uncharacterized protein n=1 Tax=Cordylochernes scorpioides TaxID=51811 RepID=A0ABY6LFL6_9ARAC|nr:hypothetical protein LAZ67_16001697 [Cordylochernes scorpioides]